MKVVGDYIEELRAQVKDLTARIEKLEGKKKKRELPGTSPVSQIRDTFLTSFKAAHGHDYPTWGARENAQAGQLLKGMELSRALMYAKIFPFWKEPAVTALGHPFGHLILRLVQLDAYLHRHEKLITDRVESRLTEKRLIQDKQQEREVINAAATATGSNSQIGFSHGVQVQVEGGDKLLGARDGSS